MRCKTCGEEKELTEFHKAKRYANGHRPYCKTCRRGKAKQYFKATVERQKQQGREYNKRRKNQCIESYGGQCRCCAETEIDFLTLDHIKDDGVKEGIRQVTGSSLYAELKRKGYPKNTGFQVLCMNCQWGKRINFGFCSHHPDVDLRKESQ